MLPHVLRRLNIVPHHEHAVSLGYGGLQQGREEGTRDGLRTLVFRAVCSNAGGTVIHLGVWKVRVRGSVRVSVSLIHSISILNYLTGMHL